MSAQLSSSLNMMLEFGDLIRSRSNSFRQASRKSSKSRRTSSASQNSSPDRSCSAKTSSPMHTQPLGMFLIVPAVHGRSTHTSTVILMTCIFMQKNLTFFFKFQGRSKSLTSIDTLEPSQSANMSTSPGGAGGLPAKPGHGLDLDCTGRLSVPPAWSADHSPTSPGFHRRRKLSTASKVSSPLDMHPCVLMTFKCNFLGV